MTSAVMDLGLAMSDPQQATVDALAQRLKELILFNELTFGSFEGERESGKLKTSTQV